MMLWKCCTQYVSKFRNSAVATGLEKVSFHFKPKKGNTKECSNYRTIELISHVSKIMLKSFKLGFNSMWTKNFQMYKLDLEKAEKPEIKLPTSARSVKKQESSTKTSIFALLNMPNLLTVWITTNCGIFLMRWEYQTTLLAAWETCMQVRKQHLEPDMDPMDWFRIGKVVRQGCILSPCLFNLYADYIMSNAMLDKSQAGILMEKYQQPQICRWYHSNGRKWRRTKRASWWG